MPATVSLIDAREGPSAIGMLSILLPWNYWPDKCGINWRGSNFKIIIFKIIIQNSSLEIGHRWMLQQCINEKSTLNRVMTRCCQATNHYVSQYHTTSLSHNDLNKHVWFINALCAELF